MLQRDSPEMSSLLDTRDAENFHKICEEAMMITERKQSKKKWGVGDVGGSTPPSTAKVEVNIADDRISLMELKLKLGRTLQTTDLGLALLGNGGEGEKKKYMSNSDGDGCVVAHAVDA